MKKRETIEDFRGTHCNEVVAYIISHFCKDIEVWVRFMGLMDKIDELVLDL